MTFLLEMRRCIAGVINSVLQIHVESPLGMNQQR
jgi:hypothetical protein